MFVVSFVFALVVSILCASIVLPLAGSRGGAEHPGLTFLELLILLLATWAGGLWILPLGPRVWGVSWAGFVAAGLFVALLVASARGRQDPRAGSTAAIPDTRASLVGPTMLLLVLLLVIAIATGYSRLLR